jgi:hypothetical protein
MPCPYRGNRPQDKVSISMHVITRTEPKDSLSPSPETFQLLEAYILRRSSMCYN